jgi:hypothetical protein
MSTEIARGFIYSDPISPENVTKVSENGTNEVDFDNQIAELCI